jgi:hypothetical protein
VPKTDQKFDLKTAGDSKDTIKLLIGFATAFISLFPFLMLPLLGLLMVLDLLFLLMPSKFASHSQIILGIMASTLFAVFLSTVCFKTLQLALKIFYIIHEIKNQSLANTHRMIFVIGTFWIPYIAMPIYYVAHFGRNKPDDKKHDILE